MRRAHPPPPSGEGGNAARDNLVNHIATTPFSANGCHYSPPGRPVVVICLDGSSDEYLDAAMVRGRMPHFQEIALTGYQIGRAHV